MIRDGVQLILSFFLRFSACFTSCHFHIAITLFREGVHVIGMVCTIPFIILVFLLEGILFFFESADVVLPPGL